MKFTKEEAVEALNGKFKNSEGKTSLQLSARSVEETLTALLPLAGDDMELSKFIDSIAYAAVDAMNRNFIHDSSDFVKNYKPTTEGKGDEGKNDDKDENTDKSKPTDDIRAVLEALKKELDPIRTQLGEITTSRKLDTRKNEIKALKDQLKLSKKWEVDFDNAVTIAELKLGDTASSKSVFDSAKEIFNSTLAAKGEKYEPQKSSGQNATVEFKEAAARRKAEKERREKSMK